jgi:hypothetical protein
MNLHMEYTLVHQQIPRNLMHAIERLVKQAGRAPLYEELRTYRRVALDL